MRYHVPVDRVAPLVPIWLVSASHSCNTPPEVILTEITDVPPLCEISTIVLVLDGKVAI